MNGDKTVRLEASYSDSVPGPQPSSWAEQSIKMFHNCDFLIAVFVEGEMLLL